MISRFLFSKIVGGCLAAGFMACLGIALPAQMTSSVTPSKDLLVAADPRDEHVFAPFVSRLRVAVREPQIRLTWQDIPTFAGSYQIFRYNAEIGLDNLDKATMIAEVNQGEEFYTDVPPENGKYFYAVLARDPNGSLYRVFIPFRNKTLAAIAVRVTPQSQDMPSEISGFQALLNGSAIQVNLASSRNTRTVAIFRSTKPMKKSDDLLQALQIWSGTGRLISYADYAVPGVPYYYAAVDLDIFQKGAAVLEADRNSLMQPVEIPLGNRRSIIAGLNTPRTVRIMPLPVLTLPDLSDKQPSLDGTNPVQVQTVLDPKVKANIVALTAGLRSSSGEKPKSAALLPSDRLQVENRSPSSILGEAKVLSEILDKNFSTRNWDESTRQLNNFLTLPLPRELIAKGHFYLGQAYYQNQHYREALLEFLYVQDELPEYAQPWIDNTLALSQLWKKD